MTDKQQNPNLIELLTETELNAAFAEYPDSATLVSVEVARDIAGLVALSVATKVVASNAPALTFETPEKGKYPWRL